MIAEPFLSVLCSANARPWYASGTRRLMYVCTDIVVSDMPNPSGSTRKLAVRSGAAHLDADVRQRSAGV